MPAGAGTFAGSHTIIPGLYTTYAKSLPSLFTFRAFVRLLCMCCPRKIRRKYQPTMRSKSQVSSCPVCGPLTTSCGLLGFSTFLSLSLLPVSRSFLTLSLSLSLTLAKVSDIFMFISSAFFYSRGLKTVYELCNSVAYPSPWNLPQPPLCCPAPHSRLLQKRNSTNDKINLQI